jgi:hypothetical protein
MVPTDELYVKCHGFKVRFPASGYVHVEGDDCAAFQKIMERAGAKIIRSSFWACNAVVNPLVIYQIYYPELLAQKKRAEALENHWS